MADLPLSPSLRPAEAAGLSDDTLDEINRLWTVVRAFSNTAHDVNNALQVIAGSAELLEARDLDPAVRRRVETIRHETGKAAAAVDRLLTYARAPRQPAQRLDLWTLVESAVGMRLASVGRGRVNLSVDRQAPGAVWIAAEAAKVLQAVIDLLLVAEDRVTGRRNARIVVRVTAEGETATVEVASGCDTEAEGAATETAGELAGLTTAAQLWAASHIATAHGGRVEVDGGTLSLLWPAAP